MNKKIKDQNLEELLENISSKSPTPGGGSVAAISGSLAASLVEMVCNLTIGKGKYESQEKEVKEISKKASQLKKDLLNLADEDSQAYDGVVEAYKISKSNEKRNQKIQNALKKAALIPLETAKKSEEVLSLSQTILEIGNKNALTDSKTAIYLSKAAIKAALENVNINLSSIKDDGFRKEIKPTIMLLSNKSRE